MHAINLFNRSEIEKVIGPATWALIATVALQVFCQSLVPAWWGISAGIIASRLWIGQVGAEQAYSRQTWVMEQIARVRNPDGASALWVACSMGIGVPFPCMGALGGFCFGAVRGLSVF